MPSYELRVSDGFDILLGHLAYQRDVDIGEIIRRAVATYAWIVRELEEHPGRKLSITNYDDMVLRDVYLP